MKISSSKLSGLALLMLPLLGVGNAGAAEADPAGELRVSESTYFARDARKQALPDRISRDEVSTDATATDGARKGRRSEREKSSGARSETPNTEFWFHAVDVELFADEDRDGYFHGIDLLFDADTIYERADVYAVLYLSREGGEWYEYAATDVFPLFGATSDDDFVVVSELLSGYPAGSYDILIELYDTWDDSFVADIGPETNPALGYLPLEDAGRDEPPDVIVVEDGGGSADFPTVLLLALTLAVTAIRSRRRPMQRAQMSRRPGRSV
jgi:hypothetical protein